MGEGKEFGIEKIHYDFSIKDGHWFWNKNPSNYGGNPDIKVMFLFNDIDLIN